MIKKLAIISLNIDDAKIYTKQIKSLFNDKVTVENYLYDSFNKKDVISADLVLISSHSLFIKTRSYLKKDSEIIIINRTLSREAFETIMNIPEETKAVLCDESIEMAEELITIIHQLGARHIEIRPTHFECDNSLNIDAAIIPGKSNYITKNVKNIINIENPLLDINTIIDIAVKLDLVYMLQGINISKSYKDLVTTKFGMSEIMGRTNRFVSQIDILLQIVRDGVIGINSDGKIYSCNDNAKKILGFNKNDILKGNAFNLLPQIPFKKVFTSLDPVKETLMKINDYDVVVSVDPIIHSNRLYGAVAILKNFSDIERKQHKLRAQLIGKGHKAKYTFSHILGNSDSINKCKEIAKRMAFSNSSILISGGSGTGKELFAQAIHNSSKRHNYQFVAVNCGAFPENLLEGELFGYEEGAFTGARKGGKTGFFELAHKGTLFLDEIGEMPIVLQTRLLRVLQERQVMRVGGDRLIDIDVRIIAATNRNLREMVKTGSFREDLYFRLNVLPLKIPPLRERREDILEIIDYMKKEFKYDFSFTPEALEIFLNHNWRGNVRELRNYIEYFSNLGLGKVGIKDLPFEYEETLCDNLLSKEEIQNSQKFLNEIENKTDKYLFVLDKLYTAYLNKKRLGRRSITEIALEKGLFISEQEIRSILITLQKYSMITISKGRSGSVITECGIKFLKHSKG